MKYMPGLAARLVPSRTPEPSVRPRERARNLRDDVERARDGCHRRCRLAGRLLCVIGATYPPHPRQNAPPVMATPCPIFRQDGLTSTMIRWHANGTRMATVAQWRSGIVTAVAMTRLAFGFTTGDIWLPKHRSPTRLWFAEPGTLPPA